MASGLSLRHMPCLTRGEMGEMRMRRLLVAAELCLPLVAGCATAENTAENAAVENTAETAVAEGTTEDAAETTEYPAIKRGDKLSDEDFELALAVTENFLKLTEIPRPSGHEEKISAFFMDWARERGFEPVQDEVGNVIFDVPATEGYEDYPRVGLQAHMDMVCVGEDPNYDPLHDPVKVVVDYDEGLMMADGTDRKSVV